MKKYSRRNFFGSLMVLPAGLWMSNFNALCGSSSASKQVKITAIKAIQLDFEHDGCLLKIETDAGLVGYGETGVTSNVARAFLLGRNFLIGADPLSIGTHFFNMTAPVHPLFAPMALISGIDIALWDLAGKILDQPVYKLLGGPFRKGCPMYSHGSYLKDMLDPVSCRSWADYIKQHSEGFTSFKLGPPFRIQMPFHPTITSDELKALSQGFANLRDAVGDSVEIGLHCHNEFDTYSAVAMANTCKPYNIVFIEDPLNSPFSDGWVKLKEGTGVPVLTGEKLLTVREFKTFLDAKAVDIIHPDISFAGGFTGCMKIADYAALTRTPVALHNVGTIIRTYASAHLSMAIQNFYKSESSLGEPGRGALAEQMTPTEPPVIKNGILQVPDRPGLGLLLDDDFLKKHLIKDEPWWG
jgi:L-alanine-DL-glutamate epimerase-like enolase superfamily enzyme